MMPNVVWGKDTKFFFVEALRGFVVVFKLFPFAISAFGWIVVNLLVKCMLA